MKIRRSPTNNKFLQKKVVRRSSSNQLNDIAIKDIATPSTALETEDFNELFKFRYKTLSRVVEKRKEYSEGKQREDIEAKSKDLQFRTKWREGLKKNTHRKVIHAVDKRILENAVKNSPQVVMSLKLDEVYNEKSVFESSLNELIADLRPKETVYESSRLKFLYHSDSSEEEQQELYAHFKDEQANETSSFISPPADILLRNRGFHDSSGHSPNKRIRNKAKKEASIPITSRLRYLHSKPIDNTMGNNKDLEEIKQIRTVGVMAKILSKKSDTGLHNISSDDTGGMTHSVKDVLSGKHTPRNNSNESPTLVSKAELPLTVTGLPSATQKNSLFASLADCVFLIGPTKTALYESLNTEVNQVMKSGSTQGLPSSKSSSPIHSRDSPNGSPNSLSGSNNAFEIDVKLPPTILFMTDCNNPTEMMALLPTYCYPSDVDVRMSSRGSGKSTPSSSRRRAMLRKFSSQFFAGTQAANNTVKSMNKAESDSERQHTAATSAQEDVPKSLKSKKSLHINVNHANSSTVNGVHNNTARFEARCISAYNSKSQFVLIFGDHTYQQYGMCMRVPMKFLDPSNQVVIYTSYVVCIMSKFPFFNYLFELMDEFDLILQGFKYSKPLSVQEVDFILQRELKLLSEFAGRLKRTIVPVYPFLLTHSSSTGGDGALIGTSSTNILETDSKARLDKSPNTGSVTYAVLGNVEFTLGAKKLKKLELSFHRSVYQSFYSNYIITTEDARKLEIINTVKNMQSKQSDAYSFTATAEHKSEKEREETFLTLLWALPVLLKYLPLDQIVLALGCAVTEMKVVVKHKDFQVISSIILALISLLHPLRWCSPVIVILPDTLLDFIDSPVPIIIGLHELPPNFALMERFVVLDPQEGMVHLSSIDVVLSHTILLPHASKLVHALRGPTETILSLTRKKKSKLRRQHSLHRIQSNTSNHNLSSHQLNEDNVDPAIPRPVGIVSHKLNTGGPADTLYPVTSNGSRKSMINIFEENINSVKSNATASASLSGMPPTVPLGGRSPQSKLNSHTPTNSDVPLDFSIPLQLDVLNEGNAKLLGAVKSFSTHVYHHIQAIVNSAILFRYEEKQHARTLRSLRIRSEDTNLKAKAISSNANNRQPGHRRNGHFISGSLDSLKLNERKGTAHQPSPRSQQHHDINGVENKQYARPPMIPKGNITSDETPTLNEWRLSSNLPQQENMRPNYQGFTPRTKLDEELSEITCSDNWRSATDEDFDSGGQNKEVAREHSFEDSNASLCSSNSSLPSLRLNAPVLALAEIGDSGTKFIKRLIDTQMFSNYCDQAKTTSTGSKTNIDHMKKLITPSDKTNHQSISTPPRSDVKISENNHMRKISWSVVGNTLPLDQESSIISHLQQVPTKSTSIEHIRSTDKSSSPTQKNFDDLDALSTAFGIILCGTITMNKNILDTEIQKYRNLYKDSAANESILVMKCSELVQSRKYKLNKDPKMLYEDAIQKYSSLDRKVNTSPSTIENAGDDDAIENTMMYENILWCNSLLCNGYCNTSLCTSICMKLWIEKLKFMRKQAVLKDIVDRHKTSNLVFQTRTVSLNGATENSPSTPQKSIPISLRPKAVVRKHRNETTSQYLQRQAICTATEKSVGEVLLNALKVRSNTNNTIKDDKNSQKRYKIPEIVTGPRSIKVTNNDKGGKEKLTYSSTAYAKQSSASSATMIIANYYAKKQKKLVQKRVKRALKVLRPHLLRFMFEYRKSKFIQSIVILQSLARGFYIRNHIPELVEALINRKIIRLLACIRIRRYFRQHENIIYDFYNSMKKSCNSRKNSFVQGSIASSLNYSDDGKYTDKRLKKLHSNIVDNNLSSSNYSIKSDFRGNSTTKVPDNSLERIHPYSDTLQANRGSPVRNLSIITTEDLNSVVSPREARSPQSNKSSGDAKHLTITTESVKSPTNSTILSPRSNSGTSLLSMGSQSATGNGIFPVTYGVQQSTALAEKAKEFLQFGKVVHSRTPSYNSAIQNLMYSKYVPDGHASNIFHTVKGSADQLQTNSSRSIDSVSTTGEKSTSKISRLKQATIEPTAANLSQLDLASNYTNDPNQSVLTGSSMSKLTDDSGNYERIDNTLNSTSSLFSELRYPISPHSVQKTTRASTAHHEESTLPTRNESPLPLISKGNDSLQNLSFCQYPVGSCNAAEAVSVPVPMVDVQYESSDDEDDVNSNRQDMILHKDKKGVNHASVNNGSSFMSKKPNLIGSIKIEEYFIQSFRDEIDGERKVRSDSITEDTRSNFGMSEMSGVPSFMSAADVRGNTFSKEFTSLSTGSRPMGGVYRYTTEANSSVHDNDNDLVYSLSVVSSLDHDEEPDDLAVASPLSDNKSPHFKSFTEKDNENATAANKTRRDMVLKGLGGKSRRLNSSSSQSLLSLTLSIHKNAKQPTPVLVDIISKSLSPSHSPLVNARHSSAHSVTSTLTSETLSAAASASNPTHRSSASMSLIHGTSDYRVPFMVGKAKKESDDDTNMLKEAHTRSDTMTLKSNGIMTETAKRSPIGRYAEENNYKIANIVSSGNALSKANHNSSMHIRNKKFGRSLEHESSGIIEQVAEVESKITSPVEDPVVSKVFVAEQTNHSKEHVQESASASVATSVAPFKSKVPSFDSRVNSLPCMDEKADPDFKGSILRRCSTQDSCSYKNGSSFTSANSREDTDADMYPYNFDEDDDDEEDPVNNTNSILQDKLNKPPLRTLGEDVGDCLTPQQLHTIVNMWELLRSGKVNIVKHGKSGKPKSRTLLCDNNLTILYWRAEGSRIDPDLDEVSPFEPIHRDSKSSASSQAQTNSTATAGMKKLFARDNTRRSSFAKSDNERMVCIQDIKEVRDDLSTEVMQRSIQKNYFSQQQQTPPVISIVMDLGDKQTAQHTLDFEIDEMYWGSIFHALQILVNFYNVIRPGLFMQKKQSIAMEPHEQRLGAAAHSAVGQHEEIGRDIHNSNITNKIRNGENDDINAGLKEVMESDESVGVAMTPKINNYLSLNNLVFHHHDKRNSHRGNNTIKHNNNA